MDKRLKLRINKLLRPFTIGLVKRLRGKKHDIIFYRKIDIPTAPAIFASAHISANDTMIATEIIRRPAHILMASDPLTAMLKLPLMLLGMVAVDRTDKTKRSQRAAMDEMAKLLQLGSHIVIYPEAIWNATADRLILPLHWGVIELAQRSGRPVIPIAMLRADNGDYYINMGDAFYVDSGQDKAEAIESLYCQLCDMTGQMVFDESIQTVKLRSEFSPHEAYANILRTEYGLDWDAKSESRFMQCNTPHIIDRSSVLRPE